MRSKYGEYWSHHRGLRPGHLFKGEIRELGRAESFLARKKGLTGETLPKQLQAMSVALADIESTSVETQSIRAVQGIVCGATSEQTREERSAVLVERSTDGL